MWQVEELFNVVKNRLLYLHLAEVTKKRIVHVKQILTGTGHPSLSIFPLYIKGNHSILSTNKFQP